MERTCDLGTGESNKSHNLEIVGLWAPEKLKIEQLYIYYLLYIYISTL